MYTQYATQKDMETHLKRANCIHIHDSKLSMAKRLTKKLDGAKLESEKINGKEIHMLRYYPKPRTTIGYAISKTGVRLNVVDFRNVGDVPFYMVQTMHGERGVKATDYRFELKVLIFAPIEAQVAA